MFSDVRSRIQRADEEIRHRITTNIPRRAANDPMTQSQLAKLQETADALRKQLAQIVDEEIASNNEACGVANNGMVLLRNEIDEKRNERDELHKSLDDIRNELRLIENDCANERTESEQARRIIAQTKQDTIQTREDAINLRAECEQMAFFQEDVDTETKHRLRADVQNLETERERDQIRLRQLNARRRELQSELEEWKESRDAHRLAAGEKEREVDEAKTTRDMYEAHREALGEHLKELGGDPRIFSWNRIRDIFGNNNLSSEIGSNNRGGGYNPSRKIDVGNQGVVPEGRNETPHSDKSARRSKQHERTKQVGGIVFGAEDGNAESPSEFLRKIPTIFKMGSNVGNTNNVGSSDRQGVYATRSNEHQRDVEFISDSNSVSAISAITMEDDAWLDSMSSMEEFTQGQGVDVNY